MADKVVVQPDDEQKSEVLGKKKKRSKCCTCLIVFAIVSVVLLAAVIGVGWFFGDKYSREFFDMSLSDTLGVLGDLYWTDDDDVVTRKYSNKDLDGFYDELKRNVLLKTDVDIDFDAAIIKVLDNYLKDTDETTKPSSASDGQAGDGSGDGQTDGGERGGQTEGKEDEAGANVVLDVFADMLKDVFKTENIDVERLKAYDAQNNDTYIFEIKDKQLAALCNMVLKAMLSQAGDIGFLSGVNEFVPLKNTVKLKQIKYVVQAKKDEQNNKIAATAAQVTVWMGLQDAARHALGVVLDDAGFGWASGFVGFLGDVILPENIYVTVTVPLEENADPMINLNDMNTAERKRAFKLFNGVFKNIMNSDMTVESLLDDFADKIKPYLKKFSDKLDFSRAGSGTLGFDIIGFAAEALSESAFKDDPLTKADMMYMLQALLTTTAEERLHELEPYLYSEWYVDSNGKAVYKYDGVDVTGMTKVDYGKELVNAIEDAYALDFGDASDVTSVLKMLGISLDGETQTEFDTSALLDKIDKAKLDASLSPSVEIKKLQITDRMLASLFSEQLSDMLKNSGSNTSDLSVELDALTFVRDERYEDHTFALAAVSVGVKDMLKTMGDNKFVELLSGLIPEKILITLKVDITLNLGAGEQYAPAEFVINNYGRTQTVLDTIKKLVPDFDLDTLTQKMESTLRDTLSQLDELLDIDLVRSDLAATPVVSGALVMPDLYTAVVKTMLTREGESKGVVTNEELRSVLYKLNSTDDFADYAQNGDKTDADLGAFLSQITDYYYLNPSSELTTLQDLTDFISAGDQKDFGKKFRVSGTTVGVKYLAYDTRTIDQITPVMTGAQLGSIIKREMSNMDSLNGSFSLLDVLITPDDISVIMKIDMAAFLPETVEKLMKAEAIYVTVTVDLTRVVNGAYPVDYVINSMSDIDMANLMKIIGFFENSFDIDSKTEEFGKIVYEKLQSLRDSLGSDSLLRFVDGGIEIASFYEFLSVKMDVANDDPDNVTQKQYAQTIKNAIQGMFERPVDTLTGEYIDEIYEGADDSLINNYRMSDFVFNAPTEHYEFDMSEIMVSGCTDRQFNSWFQQALGTNAVAVQTTVLTKGDGLTAGDREAAYNVRTWANSKIANSPANNTVDHVLVTFKMPIGKFMDSSDTASGMLPAHMCATVVLDKVSTADGDKFECVGTGINNLDVAEYDLLVKLMGLSADSEDPNKVNVKSMTNDLINQINECLTFGTMTFDPTDDISTGIGKITVTPSI